MSRRGRAQTCDKLGIRLWGVGAPRSGDGFSGLVSANAPSNFLCDEGRLAGGLVSFGFGVDVYVEQSL